MLCLFISWMKRVIFIRIQSSSIYVVCLCVYDQWQLQLCDWSLLFTIAVVLSISTKKAGLFICVVTATSLTFWTLSVDISWASAGFLCFSQKDSLTPEQMPMVQSLLKETSLAGGKEGEKECKLAKQNKDKTKTEMKVPTGTVRDGEWRKRYIEIKRGECMVSL